MLSLRGRLTFLQHPVPGVCDGLNSGDSGFGSLGLSYSNSKLELPPSSSLHYMEFSGIIPIPSQIIIHNSPFPVQFLVV